jgi:hypothetical protein
MKTNVFSAIPCVQIRFRVPEAVAGRFDHWRRALGPGHVLESLFHPVPGRDALFWHVGYYEVEDAERVVAWLREHGVEQVEDLG